MVITVRSLKKWASEKKPTTVVGNRRSGYDCPVANYLKEQGCTVSEVVGGHIVYWPAGYGSNSVFRKNKPPLERVIRAVDRLRPGDFENEVTAAEFIGVLDAVLP